MKVSWTNGVDKELAIDIRQNFKESLVMRRRLTAMLEEKVKSSLAASRSKVTYDNPNWALLQADAVGYQRALQEVVSLISNDQVDN